MNSRGPLMPSSRHMPSALPLNPTALERTWHIQDSQGQILASAFRQNPLISDLGFQIKVLNKSPQGVPSSLNSDPSLPHSLIPSLSLSHSLTPSLSGMDLVIACESRRCLIWLVHVVGPLPYPSTLLLSTEWARTASQSGSLQGRCRANMAHIRQSRTDSCLGLQIRALILFKVQ